MAFTKVVGAGIHTLSNITSHNINSSGIITATKFVGPFDGSSGDFSGNVTVDGNLVVNGDTTTLNTTLREVELLRVDATSSTAAGIVTQRGAGDIFSAYDTSTEVFTIKDGGNVGIGTNSPLTELHVHGETFTDITVHSERTSGNIGGLNFRKGGAATGIMTAQYIVDVDGSHYFYSQGSQRLKSASDGDLTITGSDNAELKLKCGTSTGNNVIAFLNSSGTTKGNIFYDSDNNFMVFKTNGTASSNERLRITSGGQVCIAHNSALHSGNLQVSTTGADAIDINSYSTSADNGGRLSFYRSKNASIGSNTIVADDDSLGRIDFRGYNTSGNSYNQGATIEARVDGSVNSSTDMPSAILFKTSADGSASPTERLRINSAGQIITNGTANPFPTRGLTLRPNSGQTNNYLSIIAGNTSSVSGVTFGTSADNDANNYRAMFEYYHSGFAHNEGLRFLSAGTEALRIRGGTAAGDILYGSGDHHIGASPGLINGLGSHHNNNVASVLFGINDGGGYNGMKVINFDDGTYNSQRIEFLTGKGGYSMATVRMSIDENGLVGIGSTIPDKRLTILTSNEDALVIKNTNTAQYNSARIHLQSMGSATDNITAFVHGNDNTGGSNSYFAIESKNSSHSYIKTLMLYKHSGDYWDINGGASGSTSVRVLDKVLNVGGNFQQTTAPFSVTTDANDYGIRLLTGSNVVLDAMNNDSAGNCEVRGYYNNNSGTQGLGFRLEASGETYFNPGGVTGLSVKSTGQTTLTRGSQGGRDSTGNASNFMKIGTWYGIDQTSRLKITIFGTSTYDSNADVAGETIIYISNNANNTMKGHFHSYSNNRACVQKVAFKMGGGNTNAEVWIKYNGSYSCTQHKVDASEGYWVGADTDTGSTSVPSGATEASSFFSVATSDGSQSYERLRISSTGEMGLGLTQDAPTGSFTMRLTETPEFNLYSTQHAQNNNCKINFGVGQSASVSGNTGARIEMNIPNTGGQMTGELKFHTNSGDNLQERLKIASDGNIYHTGDAGRIHSTRNFGEAGILVGSGNAGGATIYLDGDSNGDWSGGDYAYIRHNTSGHLDIVSTNPSDDGQITFNTGAGSYVGKITSDGVLTMTGATNSRALEINPGTGGGSVVIDRNGYITSLIRASDGGSNVGGGSGGGARLQLSKQQIYMYTYPYTTNAGDAPSYSQVFRIDTSGNFHGSSSNNISDQRLKKDIETVTDPLTKIKGLTGRTFKWKEDSTKFDDKTKYGFIAQEVETTIPELVDTEHGIVLFDKDDKVIYDEDAAVSRSKSVNETGVIPITVEALKVLISKVEILEAKVAALEGS